MKPNIKVIRYTNGALCILTPEEVYEDRGYTQRESYICSQGTPIGRIESRRMNLFGTMYADGTNGNHVRVGCESLKIDNVRLAKGDFFTIDLGGRVSTYSF